MRLHPLCALALVLAATTLAPAPARADLVGPPDTSGCATSDAGAACILANGAPGRCEHSIDPRRRRRETRCVAIPECDVVAVGAPCHGFLGRAAHCREIVDDRTHRPFRMCVLDESTYAALNDSGTAAPAPTPTPAATPTPTPTPTSPPATPTTTSRACSVNERAPAQSRGAFGLLAAASALALTVTRAKRRGTNRD
jgi:hypothetical protein